MSVKRKVMCSLRDKLRALERIDKGERLIDVAKDLGVGITTVKDWKKNRQQLLSFSVISDGHLDTQKTVKKPASETLDEALWVWFCQERERGTPLSGPLIKAKAASLHLQLNGGDQEFSASEGWLHRWKKRHGIQQYTISGEKLSADNAAANKFIATFRSIVREGELNPEQIYNIDETGLNYKMLPSKTLAAKSEHNISGHKLAKERITVAVCSNATGTHKFPLFVIGKSRKPRAFKNIWNLSSLPVYYRAQQSAWMDRNLFKEWFNDTFVPQVSQHLKIKNLPQKAILLLDNAPSHPNESELAKNNINAVFLPPNVTSLLQPMDQGVIESLKRRYRAKFVGTLLEKTAMGMSLTEAVKSLNIKDVIYILAMAWNEIPASTLIRSWHKIYPDIENNQSVIEAPPEELVTNIVQELEQLQDAPGENPNEMEVIEWLNDDEAPYNIFLTDEEIIKSLSSTREETTDPTNDDIEQKVPKISHSDAVSAFETAISYVEQQRASTPTDIMWAKKWRDYAATQRRLSLKQNTIIDFFSAGPHK